MEKERRKKTKVGNNNGQLRIATPPRVAHTKPHGPKENTSGTMVGPGSSDPMLAVKSFEGLRFVQVAATNAARKSR